TAFLEKLADEHEADVILGTHTGIHWQRELSGGRRFINVGCLGRPENDGRTNVWYAIVRTGRGGTESRVQSPVSRALSSTPADLPRHPGADSRARIAVKFVPVDYDRDRLAREMRDERLPGEFIQTIVPVGWTSCLEVLPSKERRRR